MLKAGDKAPEIALTDLHGQMRRPLTHGGAERGDLLLIFYKDSCPTCQYTLPFVERLHHQIGPRGARIVAVAQDDAEKSLAFASRFGVTFPILVDAPDYRASIAYGLEIVPSLFLVRPDGEIRLTVAGFHRKILAGMAADLAESIGAPAPVIYRDGEQVLESKPG
jgi:peroxiredoxin